MTWHYPDPDQPLLSGAWVTPTMHISYRHSVRGWAKPNGRPGKPRPRKWHYFVAEQSLCRDWCEYYGPVNDEQPDNVCVRCLRLAERRGYLT